MRPETGLEPGAELRHVVATNEVAPGTGAGALDLRPMPSRPLPSALGATLLVAACASSATPGPAPFDAGGSPFCPAGPTKPTASALALPSGTCQANEGPCDYEATPCPDVLNGAVYGYLCTCDRGAWICNVVSERGLCAPLPGDGGAVGDSGFPVGPFDATPGPVGPPGPTGPAQP